MVSKTDWHADRRRLARRLHGVQRHPLRIFSGSANEPLAEEVAACLGVAVGRSGTTRLPDTEVHVQVEELVRGLQYRGDRPFPAGIGDNSHQGALLVVQPVDFHREPPVLRQVTPVEGRAVVDLHFSQGHIGGRLQAHAPAFGAR